MTSQSSSLERGFDERKTLQHLMSLPEEERFHELTLSPSSYAVTGDSCFTETCFLVQVPTSLTVSPQA